MLFRSMLVDGKSDRMIAIRPPARPTHQACCVSAAETVELLKRIDNWILTNTCVFRRDCMIEAGGLDARLGPFADGIMARKIALTHGFFFAPAVVASWAVFSDGYSRRAALNLDQAKHFLDFIPARLRQDPVFPKWYPSVFAARWRFATSRLALETEPIDNHHVASMGARSSLDRIALKVIWTLLGRQPARLATLAWLSMRLRPTSLFELARTALARRTERRNSSRVVEGL